MVDSHTDYLVVNVLEQFLGSPKSNRDAEHKVQWEFNCPTPNCKRDKNKFNLAYQAKDKIFKCWKCGYSGFVYKITYEYGSSDNISRLKLILPEYAIGNFNIFKKPKVNHDAITCELPHGYLPLNIESSSNLYKKAWEYVVNKRKITPNQIDKFKIGYTEVGPRKFRIILPSYNSLGLMNYYEARSFLEGASIPYFKPISPDKMDIIYNEKFINWDLPIYLVEGVFDSLRILNSIPILGKTPSDLLIKKILDHNATVIVCLDADAFKDAVNVYKKLASLGINVFFVEIPGTKKDKNDISKIFENQGQIILNQVLKNMTRVDASFEITKLLNE